MPKYKPFNGVLDDTGVGLLGDIPLSDTRQDWQNAGQNIADYAGNVVQGKYAKEWGRRVFDVLNKGAEEITTGQYNPWGREDYESIFELAGFGGVTAFHGSPHLFKKFSMKHIGTGEGAQAYGHGLYFAENPATAKTYQGVGRHILGDEGEAKLLQRLNQATDLGKYDEAQVLEELLVNRSPEKVLQRFSEQGGYSPETVKTAKRIVKEIGGQFEESHLYKVAISDDAVKNFLDWDKPIHKQAPEVKKRLYAVLDEVYPDLAKYHRQAEGMSEKARTALRKKMGINIFDAEAGAGAIYETIGNPEKASRIMSKHGIKGTKYLDQGSREAGDGTYNFVVFDEDIIKMLERNGKKYKKIPNDTPLD